VPLLATSYIVREKAAATMLKTLTAVASAEEQEP